MIPFNGGRKGPSGRRTGLALDFAAVIDAVLYGSRHRDGADDLAELTAWTLTRNLLVKDAESAGRWMQAWASQNARIKRPVYHFGISLAPREHLPQAQWEYVLDRMLEHLELGEHQAFIALRRDGDKERLHIVVNRVGPDARAWKPSWDVLKQQEIARAMERELGLREVPTRRDLRFQASRNPLPSETLELPFGRRVAIVALKDLQEATCWEDLEERLAPHGLRVEPYGAGVRVSNGREHIGLAQVHISLSGPRLADRYGETLRQHHARREASR